MEIKVVFDIVVVLTGQPCDQYCDYDLDNLLQSPKKIVAMILRLKADGFFYVLGISTVTGGCSETGFGIDILYSK